MDRREFLLGVAASSLGAFAGGAGGGYAAFVLGSSEARHQERQRNARALILQYGSPEMVVTRRSAYRGVRNANVEEVAKLGPTVNLRNLVEYLHVNDQKKQMHDLKLLLSFFDLVGQHLDLEIADEELVMKGLGSYVCEWFGCYLRAYIADPDQGLEFERTRDHAMLLLCKADCAPWDKAAAQETVQCSSTASLC